MTVFETSMPPEALHPATNPDEPEFLNRDLQWLEFNRRVLFQVEDESLPLLERVRFLAIFGSNLDEFFMKRFGGLRRQISAGITEVAFEDMSPDQLLRSLRERALPMLERLAELEGQVIRPALQEVGIDIIAYADATPEERLEIDTWYRASVFPLLTPLAVDPGHRFPFISNLSTSLGVMLRRPGDDEPLFARIKVPEVIEQWHPIADSNRLVALLDVIEQHLDGLFPGMDVIEVLPFRVTRNADIDDDDDAEDLLAQIQQQLRERRFAPVVRLQVGKNPSPALLDFLCEGMEIEIRDVYEMPGVLDYTTLNEIADLQGSNLHFPPWTPFIPARLRDPGTNIFAAIRQDDILVHHPYESFASSVERFVNDAAADPKVLGIKMALYRTSGDSAFVRSLIRAAESGKQVAVLVELRARFDEARNIAWASKLENAGVHVAYGVVGLKTHTKITLVVRRESEGLRTYAHIGTGNYNSSTARLYEDVGLLTCNPLITDDVMHLFNLMTGRSRQDRYHKLLVAPFTMKRRFLELIEREINLHRPENPGHIIAKMNQLQDRKVVRALYAASQAGVKVDLIIRGFCTLRPGVPGLSDNITLISIVGRFLEHSRIFWFKNGRENPADGDFLIGSADWMYRNLHNRVEATVPVEPLALRERLWTILQTNLGDQRTAWDMQPDGTYILRHQGGPDASESTLLGTHDQLMAITRASRVDRRG